MTSIDARILLDFYNQDAFRIREKLRQKRLLKYGHDDGGCFVCGITGVRRYEYHHVGSRIFHPMVVRTCIPCHDNLSDYQSYWLSLIPRELTEDNREAALKLGSADIWQLRAEILQASPYADQKMDSFDISKNQLSRLYLSQACCLRKSVLHRLPKLVEAASSMLSNNVKDVSTTNIRQQRSRMRRNAGCHPRLSGTYKERSDILF